MWKLLSSNPKQNWVGSTFIRQKKQLKKIWEGEDYPNFGIERLLMLFLALYPFVSVGLYLRDIFRNGRYEINRKLITDAYVIFNLLLPLSVMFFGLYKYSWVVYVCLYFAIETLVTLLTMLFLNIPSAISYRRNLLCLFLNFLQYAAVFAILYMFWPDDFKLVTEDGWEMIQPLQAYYLSIETLTTVGFGDISPTGNKGYIVLIIQMTISLLLICLLFTSFVAKIGDMTYKQKEKTERKK